MSDFKKKYTVELDEVPDVLKSLCETTRDFPKWEPMVFEPDVLSKDEFKSKQRADPYEPYILDYKDGETENGDKILLSVPQCVV
jgi:hypothetical protein